MKELCTRVITKHAGWGDFYAGVLEGIGFVLVVAVVLAAVYWLAKGVE